MIFWPFKKELSKESKKLLETNKQLQEAVSRWYERYNLLEADYSEAKHLLKIKTETIEAQKTLIEILRIKLSVK